MVAHFVLKAGIIDKKTARHVGRAADVGRLEDKRGCQVSDGSAGLRPSSTVFLF